MVTLFTIHDFRAVRGVAGANGFLALHALAVPQSRRTNAGDPVHVAAVRAFARDWEIPAPEKLELGRNNLERFSALTTAKDLFKN